MNSPSTDTIDAALDAVLKASGSALKHFTMPLTLELMRKAMGAALADTYSQGVQDCLETLNEQNPPSD